MPDTAPTIYLNLASAPELEQIPGINREDAEALVAGRPFYGWDEVPRSGISAESVKTLQRSGVQFGEPTSGPIVEPGSGGSGGSPGGNLGRA